MTRSEYPDRALAVPTLYAAGAAFFAAPWAAWHEATSRNGGCMTVSGVVRI